MFDRDTFVPVMLGAAVNFIGLASGSACMLELVLLLISRHVRFQAGQEFLDFQNSCEMGEVLATVKG